MCPGIRYFRQRKQLPFSLVTVYPAIAAIHSFSGNISSDVFCTAGRDQTSVFSLTYYHWVLFNKSEENKEKSLPDFLFYWEVAYNCSTFTRGYIELKPQSESVLRFNYVAQIQQSRRSLFPSLELRASSLSLQLRARYMLIAQLTEATLFASALSFVVNLGQIPVLESLF